MNNIFNMLKDKVIFKQRALIQNLFIYIKKLEDKTRINIGSTIDKENYNLWNMDTKSFKIIYSQCLNLEEIERFDKIENSPLVQSLRKEKNLLKKSYSNEFSYA